MKSIKFLLAAFVVSAMFASCAKEEMIAVPENQNAIEGAELLGTNISVNFSRDVQTKVSATGDWEKTDKLGLGWLALASGAANTAATEPADNLVDVNHLFQKNDDGKLVTKGNVYKGWHFGYYPFTYMENMNQALVVDINPDQTGLGDADRYTSSLYLSAREFLSKETDLDDNLQLKTTFDMFQVTKSIVVKVTPDETVAGEPALQNLAITGIKVKTPDNSLFVAGNVTVNPKALPRMQKDASGKVYSMAKTKTAFYNALRNEENASDKYVLTHDARANSIEVDVDNAQINLLNAQTLRVNVLPIQATIDLTDEDEYTGGNLTAQHEEEIIVYVEGGSFSIKHVQEPETEYEETNNAAFEKLKKAYAAKGALASYHLNADSLHREGIELNLTLTADLFTPDFSHISSAAEWNQAVKVADAIGMVKNNIEFNVVDEVEVSDEHPLTIPSVGFKTGAVTTTGDGVISIVGDYEMDKKLATALDKSTTNSTTGVITIPETNKVLINKDVTLTLVDAVALRANVTNNGLIKVGYKATAANVDNTNGRIDVIYGSYVETKANKAGVVAYEVTGDDEAYKINALMKSEQNGKKVAINTFVINEGITFDLSMNTESDGNPYNPSDASNLNTEELAKMNVLMYGGTLKSNGGTNAVLNNIEVLAGENTIKNINGFNLFVKAGKATIDGSYNPYTTGKRVQEAAKFVQITNHGELIVNTDTYTNMFSNPKNATTLVGPLATIWYTVSSSKVGITDGAILKFEDSTYDPTHPTTTGARAVNAGTVYNDKALKAITYDYVSLGCDITYDNTSSSVFTPVDLTDKVFDGKGFTVRTSNKVKHGVGKAVFTLKQGAIKNVVFNAPNTQYDIVLVGTSADDVLIENCTFATATDATMIKTDTGEQYGKRAIYAGDETYSNAADKKVEVKDCYFDDKVYAFNSSSSGVDFEFSNCNLNGWMSGEGDYIFNYCEFGKSGDYQDFVPYGTATFNGCTFKPGFMISLQNTDGNTLVFDASNMVGDKYVQNPSDINWSWNGSNEDNDTATVTIVIGAASWTKDVTKTAVENNTLTW